MGIKDLDLVAVVCPHPGCKAKEQRAKDGKEKPSVLSAMPYTKNTIETERRIASAGPGGDLPLTKQDQETLNGVKMLEDQILALKNFPGDEFAEKIASREKDLQKLKAKLPVQEAQEVRDQCAMYSTLAEIEQTYHCQKQQIEAKIQKTIDQRLETVRNGTRRRRPSTTW